MAAYEFHSRSRDLRLTRKYRGFILQGRLSEPSVIVTSSAGRLIGEADSFRDATILVDCYISGELNENAY